MSRCDVPLVHAALSVARDQRGRLGRLAARFAWRQRSAALAATGALVLLPAGAARAHGPCNCSSPALGAPGTTVTARTPAYKVIFNPRPADLGIAPRHLASAFVPEVTSPTLLSRPVREPLRGARFRIPASAPPGVYLVLIFDGEEGGAHNTWDLFHVIGPARREAPTEGPAG